MPLGSSITDDFMLNIAFGRLPGYRSSTMVGINTDVNATEETVWDQGGLISFLTVAAEHFISSTSAGDTTQTVIVNGVDTDWNPKVATAVLNGQNQVSVGVFLHIQSATVLGPTASAGTVYVATASALTGGVPNTTSAIKTKIPVDDQTSHNGWVIIPNGKIGLAVAQRNSIDDTGKPIIQTIISRQLNRPPIRFSTVYVTGTQNLLFPLPISTIDVGGALSPIAPEKTIVEFRAAATQPNTLVAIGFDYVLINKDQYQGQA